ncbi:hypothetical protein [Kitasatospora sp. NPDC004289]
MGHGDLSRGEKNQLAVASATLGPWRTAAGAGALVGSAALGVNVVTGHWGADVVAGPAGLGLFVLFLVGTLGGKLRRDAADRRIHRWAAEHPWRSALPASAAFWLLNTVNLTFLGGTELFESLFSSLAPAGLLLVVAGVVGSVKRSRRAR